MLLLGDAIGCLVTRQFAEATRGELRAEGLRQVRDDGQNGDQGIGATGPMQRAHDLPDQLRCQAVAFQLLLVMDNGDQYPGVRRQPSPLLRRYSLQCRVRSLTALLPE